MADARLVRQGIETLADAGAVVRVPRVEAEVLADPEDGTGAAQLVRQAVEVLYSPPSNSQIVRVEAEVLADPEDGTGAAQLVRQAVEVLYLPPPIVRIPRFSAEVLADPEDGSGVVRLTRNALEVLYPRPVTSPVPLPLPANLEMFFHDWSSGLRLENAYLTDVTFSPHTGAEERRILREKPLRTQDVRYLNTSKEVIDRLIVNARRLTAARVPFPLYCDESIGTANSSSGQDQVWCDPTRRRFYVGARVVIVPHTADNFVPFAQLNIRTIESIEADHLVMTTNLTLSFTTARGFSVYPLIDCEYVLDPSPLFLAHRTVEWDMGVVEVLGANTLPATRDIRPANMDSLEGLPILNLNHDQNWSGGVLVTYARDGDEFSRGRGNVVDPNDYRYKQQTEWSLLAENRDAAWNVVQFLDWSRGRGRAFLQMDEEDLWTPLSITTTFIEIDPLGDFDDFEQDFDFVGIELHDGEVIARRVNTIQDLGGTWRLTISGEDLPSIDLADVRRISRVRKVRRSDDAHIEEWETLEVCRFRFNTIEILDEGEETL